MENSQRLQNTHDLEGDILLYYKTYLLSFDDEKSL